MLTRPDTRPRSGWFHSPKVVLPLRAVRLGRADDFLRFFERAPRSSHEYVLFDRVCCSFEQAGVLTKRGLMNPDLYFDAWASPTRAWEIARVAVEGLREQLGNDELYANFEWLAHRGEVWSNERAAPTAS